MSIYMALWIFVITFIKSLQLEAFDRNNIDLGCNVYLKDSDATIKSVKFNIEQTDPPRIKASHTLGGVHAYLALRGGPGGDWLQARTVRLSTSEMCLYHKPTDWCLLTSVSKDGEASAVSPFRQGTVWTWNGLKVVNVSYQQNGDQSGWTQSISEMDTNTVHSQLTSPASKMNILSIGTDYMGEFKTQAML
ncbi:hypothetical protein BCR37DRAFT_414790, partial [Protomyces lactucae-debilis]